MSTYRVLIAEDSPTQAAALRTHLVEAGFEVGVAGDGRRALAMIEAEPFDIVVSDVVMPGVDGYELCRRVNELDGNIPVVLLTSMSDPMDVVRALEAGADNFLRKPYQPADLIARVRSMLHNREIRSSGRAQMGLELFFLGRRFMINSDREQILDLLVSTFEDLVAVNLELHAREEELARAHAELSKQLTETERERARLHAVLRAIPDGMVVVDAEGRIMEANENLAELVGISSDALCGAVFWEPVAFVDHTGSPIDMAAVFASLVEHGVASSIGTSFDLFVERPDGRRFPAIVRGAPVCDRDGVLTGAVEMLEDITTLVAHDPVTGLPGHGVLVDWLRSAIDSSARGATRAAVLVATVDRYDRIQRTLTPAERDRIRLTVANRLRAALERDVRLRGRETSAAHLGPAEIAVIVPDVRDDADAIVLGERLTEALGGDVAIDDVPVRVTVTVAVAVAAPAADPADLLASVATAARTASADGGARVTTTDPTLHAEVVGRLQAEHELRQALVSGDLVVHYQPQVRVHDGRPAGVEALVRWQHPARGLLGADAVIPLATECGIIGAVGWQVIEIACRQATRWRAELACAESLVMSVNVAAEQLAEDDAVARVAAILSETGLDPSSLVLEMTESSVMGDRVVIGERLAAIKALGVLVAIDDFGTGHSSLSRLRDLPADCLKIDRDFVAGMLDQPADAAIVAGSIRLARALGLEVVAEGVETIDQLIQLRILGCEIAQGYHWAPAMASSELEVWWSEHAAAAAIGPSREAALIADDRDDDAIAYLVHELRSPLSAIVGFAVLLQESMPTSSDLVEVIIRNAWELETRLAAASDSRDALAGRGLRLQLEAVDVAEVVRTLATDLAPQLAPHRLDVVVDAPASAALDRGRFCQALTNLLTNAAKFSPPHEPIELSVMTTEDHVLVRVSDHGSGIPEQRRNELFRRFSRLGTKKKGMGIGLFLARLIVDAHGGTIWHEPNPAGGSCFSIQLPLLQAPPSPPEGDRDEPIDSATVLYIEDVHVNVALLRRVFANVSHVEIIDAATGAEGIAMASERVPDLVLLDLNLPDMRGEDVLTRLREDPATADIPVVVASGDASPERARALLERGAIEIIPKPFDLHRLRSIVSRCSSMAAPASRPRDTRAPEVGVGPLDPAMVAALRDLEDVDPSGVASLVDQFVADGQSQLQRIQDAVAEGDTDALAAAAHALAGASANFAAPGLATSCRGIEVAANAGQVPAPATIDELASSLHDAARALKRIFGTPEEVDDAAS